MCFVLSIFHCFFLLTKIGCSNRIVNPKRQGKALLLRSTSERKNFRIGKVMLSRQREFCGIAVNGGALASGLAVLVGEAGARSLASKTHRKNFHIATLLA